MDLQILVSKKGTQVVTATNLHHALQLPAHKYNSNLDKWLTDVYAFRDDVRAAIDLKDYGLRQMQFSKQKDYYLSIEMARLITLNSESTLKQKYAKYLLSLEKEQKEKAEILTKEQVVTVLELTKVMGFLSCQHSVEKEHMKKYEESNGYTYHWWKYRADVLGYSVEELKGQMKNIGKSYKGKNLRQMLMHVDKYEVIRIAVIDLFVALGKSLDYAKNMGDLSKIFAKEMQIEILDDRKPSLPFNISNINTGLMNEVKTLNKGSFLNQW